MTADRCTEPAARPLYAMVKPPSALAASLVGECERSTDLLHMTLLPFGDRERLDRRAFARILATFGALTLPPCRVVFDRLHDSGKTIALRPSEPLRHLVAMQRALVARFARTGSASPYTFRPHVTLAYRSRTAGEWAIDPVSWQITEIRLIESIVGEGRHVEHARCRLGPAAVVLGNGRGGLSVVRR